MNVTIEMASSINGLIATKDGNEDFLSNRNYKIMLDFLKHYDCLVWGNTTFKNVISWGDNYINDLKNISLIIFSKENKKSIYDNVIYCNSLDNFKEICKNNNFNNISTFYLSTNFKSFCKIRFFSFCRTIFGIYVTVFK